FHLVVVDGRKIEPRNHVLEGGTKPGKGIRQRAVEVENSEAITLHEKNRLQRVTDRRRRNKRVSLSSRSRPRAGRRRRPSASRRSRISLTARRGRRWPPRRPRTSRRASSGSSADRRRVPPANRRSSLRFRSRRAPRS